MTTTACAQVAQVRHRELEPRIASVEASGYTQAEQVVQVA